MKRPSFIWLSALAWLALAGPVTGEGKSPLERIDYHHHETALSGFLARPPDKKGARPAVLIFSDWMGVGDFSRERARRLADEGYIAFVADVYGSGVAPQNQSEAQTLAMKYKNDRLLMRERARAALQTLQAQRDVDTRQIAAIGFCFGGTVALELARSGAPLSGVVSFHGGLSTPDPRLAGNIKGKLLVLHGADDPWVPEEEVKNFEKELREAKVDWQLVKYGNAVHAFTNPQAGNDNSKGAAYNEPADRRSYKAMREFFNEIFTVR